MLSPHSLIEGIKKPLIGDNEYLLWAWSIQKAAEFYESFPDGHGVFVEIGVQAARGFRALASILKRTAGDGEWHIAGIDPTDRARKAWEERRKELGLKKTGKQSCSFYNTASCDPRAFEACGSLGIDWLYVDGCHCFDCVLIDLDTWGDAVTQGGIMVCHDTSLRKWYGKMDLCFGDGSKKPRRSRWGVHAALESSKVMSDFDEIARLEEDGEAGIRIFQKKG